MNVIAATGLGGSLCDMFLSDVLLATQRKDAMGRPIPFELCWVELDKGRKRGGRWRRERNLVRAGAAHNLRKSRQIAVRKADGSQHEWPVRLRLITRFNGKAVHI